MNRKISRILQPSMRLYFIVIVLFAIAASLVNLHLGAGFGIVGLILFIYSKITVARSRSVLLDYVEELADSVQVVGRDNMLNFPMPMVIFRLESGGIIWSNERFLEMTQDRKHVFEVMVSDVLPGFDARWLMEGETKAPELTKIGDKHYQAYGYVVKIGEEEKYPRFLANVYWMDVTAYALMEEKFWHTRPVCSLIVLDNYGELLGNVAEKEKSSILATVDDKISEWTQASGGFLCRFDRDRYVHIVESVQLEQYTQGRFALLDSVREVINSAGIAATVSIGIGKDGASFKEDYENAKLGIEMALSRGGDQVVIKDRYNFEFFGGRGGAVERRTKVKSRVTAGELQKLMQTAERVFVMGHRYGDYDSLGAACGVCCIARKNQKEAQIILHPDQHAVAPLLTRFRDVPEYEKIFITPQEALAKVGKNHLLIVVDTNRPDQVEVPELLDQAGFVVVIDHHRRAADYIQDATINFHEPYASSTCELVTELLQYAVNQGDILRVEAEGLLAGIAMDTKNFSVRTGSRTFEAAAFLRRLGANTADIKRLMQSDFSGTVARYDVIRQAGLYREGIAIAAPTQTIDRVTGAVAADELLDIAGIQASFVLYPFGEGVVISARSLGDVNVQFILEKLGGGGNRNTAGAQVKEKELSEVMGELKLAIDDYFAQISDTEETQKEEN